jgi:hypothetical protein
MRVTTSGIASELYINVCIYHVYTYAHIHRDRIGYMTIDVYHLLLVISSVISQRETIVIVECTCS